MCCTQSKSKKLDKKAGSRNWIQELEKEASTRKLDWGARLMSSSWAQIRAKSGARARIWSKKLEQGAGARTLNKSDWIGGLN